MPTRRRTTPTKSSPLAKAGQALGGLLSARAGGTTKGGRVGRGGQAQSSGLSKLLRAAKRR